jgi:hypothetical protein
MGPERRKDLLFSVWGAVGARSILAVHIVVVDKMQYAVTVRRDELEVLRLSP